MTSLAPRFQSQNTRIAACTVVLAVVLLVHPRRGGPGSKPLLQVLASDRRWLHGRDFRDSTRKNDARRPPSANSQAVNTDWEFQREQVLFDLEPRC